MSSLFFCALPPSFYPLATNTRVLCISPGYLLRHGHSRLPADLAKCDACG